MRQKLALGWITAGQVEGLFMQSVTNLLLADASKGNQSRITHGAGGTSVLFSGPRIAHARNQLVGSFLKTDSDWLLMLDTDMVFKPEDVDALFEVADKDTCPIVGGLYFAGGLGGTMFPQMFLLPENPGEDMRRVLDYPESGLCSVDATGAGFLMVHRSVLEKMGELFKGPYPWFVEGSVYGNVAFGEDWAFCLRAWAMDIPVHVHTGIKLGHIKPHVLDEEMYWAYRAKGTDEEILAKTKEKFGLEKV
jgi:hypothetical protein